MEAEETEKALAECEKAIRKNPDDPSTYNKRGMVFAELKRNEEAVESFKKAIGLDRGYVEAYCHLGVTLHEMGRYEEAIEAFTKAIGIDPDNSHIYNQRARTLIESSKSSQPEQAKRYLEAAFKDAMNAFELSHGQIGCYNIGRAAINFKRLKENSRAHDNGGGE